MTKSYRIAIASSGLGHVARGIEAWAEDLGTALADRGQNVILCKGAGAAIRPFERVISCLEREAIATRRLQRLMPRRLFWRIGLGNGYGIEQTTFALNLIRTLRRERIDLLHVQDSHVAVITQYARRIGLIQTKTILAHGTEETPEFLKRIQYLQHLAPWHLEQMKAIGVWKPTWTAIPNFIDTERYRSGPSATLRSELDIPENGLIVLTAAAIKRHHKRIDYLIAEFARFRAEHPELPIWLVIAGGWEKETDELISEGKQKLGDRVRFLVRFPRTRMPDLYRAANLFVLCSLFEMMPIALIEATATGLPCIVNRHPILEWMTESGGLRIDMDIPGRLAAALTETLTGAEERHKLGLAAREHCIESFSQDSVVNQILAYYQQIMNE